jgi:hypothetical protein
MAESFNGASVALTTTSITDVYQAPTSDAANRSIVLSCLVANVVSSNVTITITKTDSGNAVLSRIAKDVVVPGGASFESIQNKLVLKQGEKLRATASSGSALEVTVSALEVTP